jgi:hypothetical protein
VRYLLDEGVDPLEETRPVPHSGGGDVSGGSELELAGGITLSGWA